MITSNTGFYYCVAVRGTLRETFESEPKFCKMSSIKEEQGDIDTELSGDGQSASGDHQQDEGFVSNNNSTVETLTFDNDS